MEPTEKAAHEILATLEATYQATHRYVRVKPADFPHLDIGWYEKTSRLLATKGFRTVADVEDKTITEAPGTVLSAILVRALLSRDGTVTAALYHPHIKKLWVRVMLWLLRKTPGKVVDMETEFTDGSFVATSNAASAAALGNGPMILAEFLPFTTTPLEVHARHVQRVAEHLEQRSGIAPRAMNSYDDMLASQHRMNALKAAYRGEIGVVTKEELDRLAVFGKGLTAQVHAEIQAERMRRTG
jgi:hypothetical protein